MGYVPARDVRRRLVLVATVAAAMVVPTVVYAQLFGRRVEVFGTVGGIAGATPVRIDGSSHIGAHAGFRLDAGIQGERLALAVGTRLWELNPTSSYGGHGLDGLFIGEWRLGSGTRTSVRASVGAGFDEIDGGHGPDREHTGTSGALWSIGAARELIAPSGALVILSADLVVPNVNTDVNGRRRPVLELGFGYRFRSYASISPLPSPKAPR